MKPIAGIVLASVMWGGELAPTGTLRAAMLDNPIQGRMSPSGEGTGPAPDIVRELARRLGVPYKITVVPGAAGIIAQVKAHTVDIGFLAIEAGRANEVDFAGGYLMMPNSFLVAASSPIRTSNDADAKGRTIAAVRGQSQQIYLAGNLKNATLRTLDAMPPQAEVERLLTSGEVDAFGINRQRSQDAATASKNKLRVLDDRFLMIEQAMVVEKGDKEKAAYLSKFIEELKKSGFLKESIVRAQLGGVEVSPAK